MNNIRIGQRIASTRNRTGVSTAELARRIGRSQATISRIENGKQTVSLEILGAIARALDVPALSLLSDGDPREGCPIPREIPSARTAPGGCLARMLRAARQRARLTPAETAREIGAEEADLLAWERGDGAPPPATLERMGALYPVAADALEGVAHIETSYPTLARHLSVMEQLLSVFHGCLHRRGAGLRLSPAWSEVAREMDEVLSVFNPDVTAAERRADYFSIGHLSDRLLAALQDPAFHREVEALAERFAARPEDAAAAPSRPVDDGSGPDGR